MKKFLAAILITISLSASAAKVGEVILTTIFTGGPTVLLYSHYWYDDFKGKNGLYMIPTLDLKMISETNIDFKNYTSIKMNRFEPYIAWEVFNQPVNLVAYTVGLDYRLIDKRMWFDVGFETGMIDNQEQKVWTNALCGEIGIETNYGYSFVYRGDFQTRPELTGVSSDMRIFGDVVKYNGRIGIVIPLITRKYEKATHCPVPWN